MLGRIFLCGIIGLAVWVFTKISLIGWIVGIFLFVVGLPGALIGGFVDDCIDRRQDREDYRQMMSDFNTDMRADEHEYREDKRAEKRKRSLTRINVDEKHLHLHGGG